MTTTIWTAIIAISAISLVSSPAVTPLRAPHANVRVITGGPPDTLVAVPTATTIRWKGTGLGGRGARAGAVTLASGLFVIRHEQLTSGTFTINMKSLDAPLHAAGLFDVEHHPTAMFRSTGARRIGPAQWQVAGDLTMRGVTRPITFDTDVSWPEMGHMVATSQFTIDRRQWGIGEGMTRAANAVIDDDIQLSLTLDARRKQPSVATR
jgi:polyisoprenoid-binding protein YceI